MNWTIIEINLWVLTGGIRRTRIGGVASDEMTWKLDSDEIVDGSDNLRFGGIDG